MKATYWPLTKGKQNIKHSLLILGGLLACILLLQCTLLASHAHSQKNAAPQIGLTEEDLQWISEHKNIRLGADPDWPPFEFFEFTSHAGLSAQYIKRLSRDTGLTFSAPPILNWTDSLRQAKAGKIDVLACIVKTPNRSKDLAFSNPYAKYPLGVYQRTNSTPADSMQKLNGLSVAVVSGYASEEMLKENHPDIIIQPYRTLEKALMALSKGMVDALVDNPVAVEVIKQKHSLFNLAATFKTPYIQELRFGVRKDWGPLVRIIDKWLDTLSDEDRQQLLDMADVELDERLFLNEATPRQIDSKQLIMIGGGIALTFGAALIILLFLRRFIRSKAEHLYSSHQYKTVGIVVGILFLCVVAVATWTALSQVESQVRTNVGDTLESVLLTTHEALAIWENQHKRNAIELANLPAVSGLTSALLAMPAHKDTILASPQLWNLRRLMRKAQKAKGFTSYAITSKSSIIFAAPGDTAILDKNILSIQRPRMLDKVFLGTSLFIPPIKYHGEIAGDGVEREYTLVSVATPIYGSNGSIIGALILYYNANEDYQRIISLGRMGTTGETYAFDKYGSLVSNIRFDKLIRKLRLVNQDQQGMLNLRIADPGNNLMEGHQFDRDTIYPLTKSVKSATDRKSGLDIEGYRDYRGVSVYGAWLWDEELGIGLVTEIDEQEALGSFRLVRNTVAIVIFITILLGTLMTGLSNWIGQSAAKSLQKAKDELEDRVEERTEDLKKISVAVEQSPAMVFITNTQGKIEYVNPKFNEITGFRPDEAQGQTPRILKSGAHPDSFYKDLWETILAGQSWNGDILNKKKDGHPFWVRASIAPLRSDSHELTHFVAVMEDITERKAEEERFQALLDAAPDAMVLVSSNGDISLVNIATEELFGYTREEMIGNKVEMLLPDYIRPDHPKYRDKFFARPGDMSLVAGKEFYGQNKNGDQIPVDISLSPIEIEDGIQIIASIRDITERKKAEEAIAESEQRTRLILSNVGEGIFGVNLKGNVVFINDAALTMLGYPEHEIMGQPVHELIHHTRPDGSFYPVEECPMRHAFVDGTHSRIDDEVLWRKDGTKFMVEYVAVPVMRDEKKIGAVISFADITERKAMEDALIEAKDKAEVLSRDFSNFLESTSDLVYLKDTDLRYLACSKPLAEMLGYRDWRAIVGKTDAEIENDNTAIRFTSEPELQVINNGEVLSLEENIIKRGNKMGWASTIKKPLLNADGSTVGILSISRDITEMIEMTHALEHAKAETEDALGVVTSSIQYASRIQRSVLPMEGRIDTFTQDHFVVWEPRDVVGGDIYWCEQWGRGSLIILGDCTGHGVPGAFMTLLSTGALERALLEVPPGDSARLVSRMHQMIQSQLGQDTKQNGDFSSDDGLELGICYINPKGRKVVYAGARMPLFVDHNGTIEVIKGDKKGIAYRGIPADFEYTNKEIKVQEAMRFYMTTDGIIDQIGGEKRRGFGKKRFKALIESLRDTPLQKQGDEIYSALQTYQGKEKRRDDVSIIGFRL